MIKKLVVILFALYVAGQAFGQVYQAGHREERQEKLARWEVSAAWGRAGAGVNDLGGGHLVKKEEALSLRGLYYAAPWVGVGLEGTWFSDEHFPLNNTYEHARYGAVVKGIITPHTRPSLYVLGGVGRSNRELSYLGGIHHKKHSMYASVGVGIEMPLAYGIFAAAELQRIYNAHRQLDGLVKLRRHWETAYALRLGIRF